MHACMYCTRSGTSECVDVQFHLFAPCFVCISTTDPPEQSPSGEYIPPRLQARGLIVGVFRVRHFSHIQSCSRARPRASLDGNGRDQSLHRGVLRLGSKGWVCARKSTRVYLTSLASMLLNTLGPLHCFLRPGLHGPDKGLRSAFDACQRRNTNSLFFLPRVGRHFAECARGPIRWFGGADVSHDAGSGLHCMQRPRGDSQAAARAARGPNR